jgi:hypothetical protein
VRIFEVCVVFVERHTGDPPRHRRCIKAEFLAYDLRERGGKGPQSGVLGLRGTYSSPFNSFTAERERKPYPAAVKSEMEA